MGLSSKSQVLSSPSVIVSIQNHMKKTKETTSQNKEIVQSSGSKKLEAKLPALLEVDIKIIAHI